MSDIIENFKKLEDRVDNLIDRYQKCPLSNDFYDNKKNEYKNNMVTLSNDIDCIVSKIDGLIFFIEKYNDNNIW